MAILGVVAICCAPIAFELLKARREKRHSAVGVADVAHDLLEPGLGELIDEARRPRRPALIAPLVMPPGAYRRRIVSPSLASPSAPAPRHAYRGDLHGSRPVRPPGVQPGSVQPEDRADPGADQTGERTGLEREGWPRW